MKWIAVALLGLATDANAKSLLLSSAQAQAQAQAQEDNDDGFNPAHAVFELLAQCAEVDLDKETCLVTKTLDTIISMDGPPQDDGATFPTTRHRVLQEEDEEECRPELSEQDLRNIMYASRADCTQVSIEYSNQDFEDTVGEFWKVFSSESCWNELCESPDIMVKLMFDHAVQCAQVEFDVDQCITDHIMSMLFGGPDDSYDDDDDYYGRGGTDDSLTTNHTHHVLRSLQEVMNGESNDDCVVVNEFELEFIASFFLMEVEGRCTELGVLVTPEDISKASADFVKLFGSPHCWGDAHACPDEGDDDYYTSNNNITDVDDVFEPKQGFGQLDHFMIAVKYVEQCASIDLNLDSCLSMKTIDFFKSWDSSPSMQRRSLEESSDNVAGQDCIVPEIDTATLQVIAFDAKQQCIAATGTPISDEEYSSSVEVMQDFLDAENCWLSLCEEDETPSRMLLEIIFEEIGICAQANLDAIDPCLLNQIFEIMFISEESSPSLGDVRRKLQRSLSQHHDRSIPEDHDCEEQPSDEEVYFVINFLLSGASASCDVSSSQVSNAEAELFKLFRAESCWGENNGCEHNEDHNRQGQVEASYLEFVENNAIDMLAQCAEITDEATTCVFWRSLETLRFMGMGDDAQAGNSNGPLLQHAFQEAAANICTPPSVTDSDINNIVAHAKDHCVQIGLPVESHHPSQAVADLKKLIAKPACFEDLCSPESREMIVEEWMDECSGTDTKFLTRPTYQWSDDSSQALDNDKLRCMTNYLMQTLFSPWECILPHISPSICGLDPTNPSDVMKEAIIYCSGGEVYHPPTPSPEMSSMSFVYNEGNLNNWSDLNQEYFSFSMSYWQGDGHGPGNPHGHDDTSAMLPYVIEVCHLLGDLDTDQSRECLKPVCDYGVEGALFDYSGDMNDDNDDKWEWKSIVPTYAPTLVSTPTPSTKPTRQPSRQPTKQPTPRPTKKPTSSPTVIETGGVIEVKFEVALTLSGIDTSDLDITSLDSVITLLETVIQDMLPDGAKARLLKVGGFSLTRRLLRFLEEENSNENGGVDVEFEIIFSERCDGGDECDDYKENLLKEANVFSTDIVQKVEDGSLSTEIQKKAAEQEIEVLKSISVSPTSLKVSAPEATVTIVKEQQEEVPDEDSAAPVMRVSMAVFAVAFAGFTL